MSPEPIRRVIFRPYRKGMGPSFTLTLWDAGERYEATGRRNYIRYKLTQTGSAYTATMRYRRVTTELFTGDDFSPGPMHAIDSDACVRGLMGFLTLRPGDTDSDYFREYTDEQRRFCDEHAEALSAEVMARLGEE